MAEIEDSSGSNGVLSLKRKAISFNRLQDPKLWNKISWIRTNFIKDADAGVRKTDFYNFVTEHMGKVGYRDLWHLLKMAYPHVERVRRGRKYMYWGIRHADCDPWKGFTPQDDAMEEEDQSPDPVIPEDLESSVSHSLEDPSQDSEPKGEFSHPQEPASNGECPVLSAVSKDDTSREQMQKHVPFSIDVSKNSEQSRSEQPPDNVQIKQEKTCDSTMPEQYDENASIEVVAVESMEKHVYASFEDYKEAVNAKRIKDLTIKTELVDSKDCDQRRSALEYKVDARHRRSERKKKKRDLTRDSIRRDGMEIVKLTTGCHVGVAKSPQVDTMEGIRQGQGQRKALTSGHLPKFETSVKSEVIVLDDDNEDDDDEDATSGPQTRSQQRSSTPPLQIFSADLFMKKEASDEMKDFTSDSSTFQFHRLSEKSPCDVLFEVKDEPVSPKEICSNKLEEDDPDITDEHCLVEEGRNNESHCKTLKSKETSCDVCLPFEKKAFLSEQDSTRGTRDKLSLNLLEPQNINKLCIPLLYVDKKSNDKIAQCVESNELSQRSQEHITNSKGMSFTDNNTHVPVSVTMVSETLTPSSDVTVKYGNGPMQKEDECTYYDPIIVSVGSIAPIDDSITTVLLSDDEHEQWIETKDISIQTDEPAPKVCSIHGKITAATNYVTSTARDSSGVPATLLRQDTIATRTPTAAQPYSSAINAISGVSENVTTNYRTIAARGDVKGISEVDITSSRVTTPENTGQSVTVVFQRSPETEVIANKGILFSKTFNPSVVRDAIIAGRTVLKSSYPAIGRITSSTSSDRLQSQGEHPLAVRKSPDTARTSRNSPTQILGSMSVMAPQNLSVAEKDISTQQCFPKLAGNATRIAGIPGMTKPASCVTVQGIQGLNMPLVTGKPATSPTSQEQIISDKVSILSKTTEVTGRSFNKGPTQEFPRSGIATNHSASSVSSMSPSGILARAVLASTIAGRTIPLTSGREQTIGAVEPRLIGNNDSIAQDTFDQIAGIDTHKASRYDDVTNSGILNAARYNSMTIAGTVNASGSVQQLGMSQQVDSTSGPSQLNKTEVIRKLLGDQEIRRNSPVYSSLSDLRARVQCLSTELEKERSARLQLEIELRKVQTQLSQERRMSEELAFMLMKK